MNEFIVPALAIAIIVSLTIFTFVWSENGSKDITSREST